MYRRPCLFVLIVALIGASPARSDEWAGGQAGDFLRVSVGARAGGLGGAFAAIADDATALYFNPGGLYQSKGMAFSGSYSFMSLDRRHYAASAVYGEERLGSFAAMLSGFGISEIDGRDGQGMQTGDFDDSELAFSLGYARGIGGIVGIGAAVKYLHHSLADNAASGYGFDLGIHSRIKSSSRALPVVRLGLSASNLGSEIEWDTRSGHKEEIPSTVRFGAALDVAMAPVTAILIVEARSTADLETEFLGGVEAWIHKTLALRVGLDGEDLTFGMSARYRLVDVHYAYCVDAMEEGPTSKIEVQIKSKRDEQDDRRDRRRGDRRPRTRGRSGRRR